MGAQQADTSLEEWLQAYVDEKGTAPRNALQLCAFARHRGAALKYREVCGALGKVSQGSPGDSDISGLSELASSPEHDRRFSQASKAQSADSEGFNLTPRDLRLQQLDVACPSSPSNGGASASNARATSLDQACFRCHSPERQLAPAKLRLSWMLQLMGESRETKVELLYSRRTGKKQVFIDGKPMYKSFQQNFEWSWEHPENEARIFLRSENGHHELFCEDKPGSNISSASRAVPLPAIATELVAGGASVTSAAAEDSVMAEEAASSRGSALPLSWRDPDDSTCVHPEAAMAAGARRGAPITPRGERVMFAAAVPGTEASSSSSPIQRTRAVAAVQQVRERVLETEQIAWGSGAVEHPPRDNVNLRRHPATGVVDTLVQTTEACIGEGGAASSGSARPWSKADAKSIARHGHAASAPDLRLDCGGGLPGTPGPVRSNSPSASGSSPRVPRLLLPTTGLLPRTPSTTAIAPSSNSLSGSGVIFSETTQPPPDGRGAYSPTLQLQYRHSRSTPILSKMQEYLSAAARPAAAPPRPAATVAASLLHHFPTASSTISQLSSQSPGVPKSPMLQFSSQSPGAPRSPTSSTSGSASLPSGPAVNSAGVIVGARLTAVDNTQGIAAVRARWGSASENHRLAAPVVLEPVLESESSKEFLVGPEAEAARRSGRSLVRTSSAPGQFQPLRAAAGDILGADDDEDDEDVQFFGGAAFGAAFFPNVVPAGQARTPVVPRIKFDRAIVEENIDKGVVRSSPPGVVGWKTQSPQMPAPTSISQPYYMVQTGPVAWTPRGTSPTRTSPNHQRLATPVPDQTRAVTLANSALTPRYPHVVQGSGISHTVLTGANAHMWSSMPSVYQPQPPPLSPFSVSPARIRTTNYGYPAGPAGPANNMPRAGRVMVQAPLIGAPQSATFPLGLGESGTRSVGMPPPAFAIPGAPGSQTPPTSTIGVWADMANVVNASMQRRVRHSAQ